LSSDDDPPSDVYSTVQTRLLHSRYETLMACLRRVAVLALAVDALSVHVMGGGTGWVDPDTPAEMFMQQSLVDGKALTLVMSDEFNVAGRTFNDGHDPRWTALNKNDYTNNALQ